jgi:hemoglobin-like flavoprotein
MSITPHQIELIQESFKKVEPIAEAAAEIFYAKLFEYDPKLKSLFKHDMKDQGRKLMTTLKVAVNGLNDLDKLVVVLQNLAIRHIDYNVKAEDYTPVGNALLYTLKTGLGDDWTPELREAWVAVYRLMASVMKEHSYQ